jgi:hypothetical protein
MKTIKLEYPLMVMDPDAPEGERMKEVRELTLGRLKAKHLRLMPESMFDDGGESVKPHDVMPLIAGLANIPLETVEEMDVADLMKVGEALGSFLSDSLQTGKKSSGG